MSNIPITQTDALLVNLANLITVMQELVGKLETALPVTLVDDSGDPIDGNNPLSVEVQA